MALDLLSSTSSEHLEEDYIDMELNSYSNLFSKISISTSNSSSSPPYNNNNNPREFEFQMSSSTRDHRDQPTTSPADELFYKGKLLPLHLPPRLQMVEKLLENSINNNPTFSSSSSSFDHLNSFDHDFFSTPLTTTAPTPTATSTPFESCNISPSESFRVSPDEYMCEYSAESLLSSITNNNNDHEMIISSIKSLAKRLNKQSSSVLGSKLKASRAYLKSLFGKSGCSDESSTAARRLSGEGSGSKCVAKAKNNPFGRIQRNHHHHHHHHQPNNVAKEVITTSTDNVCSGRRHRRSFSLVLRRHSTTTTTMATTTNKSSSSSSLSSTSSSSSGSSSFSWSSNNSNGRDQLKYFKRCGSAKYSEQESSIQGAIAHCKQSHQKILSARSSVSASRIGVCDEQEREELCRG